MDTIASAQLDKGVVEKQLQKVLASPQFADTTRLNRFLEYLVRQSLDGNSDALKGYVIGVDVFDKPDDFDPSIDTIVRVQAGKLRTRLDLYYATDGRDDPLRIVVPKGSYAPVFEFALDPEPRAGQFVDDGPNNQKTQAQLLEKYSIAVLPFDNLSGDPDQEFLADGLTEEILNALARFRELRVISRHSTFRYKDRSSDPREIGEDLGVRYVLEGSVRRWRDQVRVTAQLIETKSGTHLTSDVYDRDISAESLFDIQEDVAARIAAEIAEPHGVIHRTGGPRRRRETSNLDAYECRLLASEYWRSPNADLHAKVRDLLERAVNIDPNYAGAWAMLSIVYGDEVRGGYNFIAEPAPLDRALNAAKTAIELDPTNAAGHHALFMTHFNRGEISAYQRAAKQALALNPNYPDLLADYGACLGFTGNWDLGIPYVMRAVELSPHPPGWYKAVLAIYHYLHGRYEDALAQTESIDLGSFFWGQLIRAMIHGQLGNETAATEAIANVKREIPHFEKIAAGSLRLWNIKGKDADHMMDGWRKAGLNL